MKNLGLNIDTVFSGFGPFPATGTFETDLDGQVLLIVSGTAYSNKNNIPIGIRVTIDSGIYAIPVLFANESMSHKTLVSTCAAPFKITHGTHKFAIQTLDGTVCDNYDYLTATLWPALDDTFVFTFNGPLPNFRTFESHASGTAMIYLSGSAWVDKPNQPIGISVVIDDKPVLTSTTFVNPASSHHAVPTVLAPVDLTPGTHKIGVVTTGAIKTDENDFYTVVVMF